MTSIGMLATFFGWLTIVNIGIYILVAIGTTVFRGMTVRMNTKLFGLSEADVLRENLRFVAHYKLAITVLCFAPYLTLKIIG